jgi:hypothetical protein
MTQLDEILEKLRLHKAEIFARFPLTELGVFGRMLEVKIPKTAIWMC